MIRKNLVLVSVFVSAFVVSAGSASARADKWKEMGTRWAVRTEDGGRVKAVYDLSFPTILDRIRIATVDTRKLDVRAAIEFLRSSKDARALELLKQVDEGQITAAERAPEDWWKQVPWKNRVNVLANQAPAAFSLSEIDYDRVALAPGKFHQALKKLEETVVDPDEGPVLGADFLSRIRFERGKEPGVYEVYWQPAPPSKSFLSSHGKKILDMVSVHSGLEQALAWDGVSKLVSLAVNQIPIPFIQNLVSLAVSRLFSYRSELARLHEEMAIEMLTASHDPSMRDAGFCPFDPLPAADVSLGVKSVYLAESTLISVLRWIVLRPVKTWLKDMDGWDKRSLAAANWLSKHGIDLKMINPHFGVGTESATGHQYLYLMSQYRLLPALIHPMEAIDYQHPEKVRAERLATTAASLAGEFALEFIPTVGGTLSSLYKSAVEKSMKDSQEWESKLMAYLWERAAAGENWDRELAILENQRLNPFEVSLVDALKLVELRRKSLAQE